MPDSVQALFVVALIIAPGYITLSIIRRRTNSIGVLTDTEFVVSAVGVGVLVQAIAYPWPGRQVIQDYVDKDISNTLNVFWWLLAVLVVLPAIGGTVVVTAIDRLGMRLGFVGLDPSRRISRAWVYALRRNGSYVRIGLNGDKGEVIGGKYSTDSLASVDPEYVDIFLEEVWELDQNIFAFIKADSNSYGIWISPDAINRIEFIKESGNHA